MGFSSGLPLLLIGSTLKARMTEAGIDLKTIGVFSLVGLPYVLKFLWSPFLDRIQFARFGRRRGCLLIVQPLLALSLVVLARIDVSGSRWILALSCMGVGFLSATQDILIDSYRREILSDQELGWGSSVALNGYRIAMLVSGAFALFLADHLSWTYVYSVMALLMLIGFVTTVFAHEPQQIVPPPSSLRQAVVEPFVELFRRPKVVTFIAFVILYKIGDSMASDMTVPFFLHIGFTKTEIGTVAKLFGFWATIAGGLIGGIILLRIGILQALWMFGLLQGASIISFSLLTWTGNNLAWLASVITLENFTSGMGTAAYAAFLAQSTNRKFTATQYALLSSLTGVPRVLLGSSGGFLVEWLSWGGFFVFCTLLAIPGLILLAVLTKHQKFEFAERA